ncbi:aminoglycoside phosphotransferase family protein [Halomonas sp. ISL-56]|uniref:aminoglycoside phosphotransferase family protein n=1 Tax=Halomonas sp. ISL-56 TaxID=2819149 RepID=UPI001BEC349B|nr:aminoglycoside phosphotransferase family protein [Halomonas sp. ISL-56]MBT2801127.1 aminoglycoside phosphotransferase family protein [Halomonas sp. ISL-56]
MLKVIKKPTVTGFIDRVSEDAISGWSLAPYVTVMVNGRARCRLSCTRQRADVKEAGLSLSGKVGFHGSLALSHGDVVRVITPNGVPLRHSPWLYRHPKQSDWLPVAISHQHAEYKALAALPDQFVVEKFKPLFGQSAERQIAGAVLKVADQAPLMARFDVEPKAHANVKQLYDKVIIPCRISAPPLLAAFPQDKHMLQIFAFQPGITLEDVGNGWEAWVPLVMTELLALQQAGIAGRRTLKRRTSRFKSLLHKLLPSVFAQTLREGGGRLEWSFLGFLMRVIARLPRVLSHGDLHRNNVLVDTQHNQVALIDWDRWGYLPLGFDAALLLRGLPWVAVENLVEKLIEERVDQQLGILVFTYLFQCLDVANFMRSQQAALLRARIYTLYKQFKLYPGISK